MTGIPTATQTPVALPADFGGDWTGKEHDDCIPLTINLLSSLERFLESGRMRPTNLNRNLMEMPCVLTEVFHYADFVPVDIVLTI
jgi:hypothetical protein